MRKKITTALLLIAFFAGLVLLVYPPFSEWYNSYHQSRVVISYAESVSNIDQERYEQTLQEAREYNARLAERGIIWEPTEQELAVYNEMLNITDDNVMAYIDIPKIGVLLPIYHGTSDKVLQTAIGHLEGSSLPVGGESSNCLLSGHRGMPNARLFTDIVKLNEGDVFMIRTLNEVLTYEVDQINIIEPYDLSLLNIDEGKDWCTLITCTPYGVNTHRYIVRGHRIETVDETSVIVPADALQLESRFVAVIIAMPILMFLVVVLLLKTGKRKPNTVVNELLKRRKEYETRSKRP